jgi:hypothetical protein
MLIMVYLVGCVFEVIEEYKRGDQSGLVQKGSFSITTPPQYLLIMALARSRGKKIEIKFKGTCQFCKCWVSQSH